jgi:hypothetical protein
MELTVTEESRQQWLSLGAIVYGALFLVMKSRKS